MITNLRKILEANSYVSHLILQGNRADMHEMVSAPDYDITQANLVVTINGFVINADTLENLLDDWSTRLSRQKIGEMAKRAENVALLQTEEGLLEKARELAKDMCYKMAEKFEWD